MCSQLSGDVWGSHVSGAVSHLMKVSHSIGNIGGVPDQKTIAAMTRLSPEARNCLRLGAAIGDPAMFARYREAEP
jgi:hypothetical protein